MLLTALCATACSAPRTLTTDTVSRTADTVRVATVERDTVVVTEPDSALFWAWVRCDSLGNILIEQLNAERGRHTAVTPSVVTNGRQTLLRVAATSQPESVIVRRRETVRLASRTSDTSATASQTVPQRSPSLIRLALTAIALFLLGVASGYLLKSFR